MNLEEFQQNNLRNCLLQSEIPVITKKEPCWLGIDEAGRGPVLGPMVYGTCYSPLSHREYLEELGLADSKTLNEEQRERTFQKISDASEQIGWMVEILSPTYISNSMLKRSKYNLNALSHDSAIHLMQKVLDLGVNVAEVYVDTVGDPGKYQAKLKELFPSLEITVAKKADSTYPIVSAASICAKVVRDHALKEWTFVEGFSFSSDDYGSGYPNDPLTKKFLRGHMDKVFGFPHLVRFSWSTASLILDKEAVPMQWEDEEEEMNNSKNTPSLLTFFHKVPGSQEKYKQHKFFKDRCLSNLPEL